ncbi:MAG: biotin transporter BioY [Deltaproteobacteria bacterium]|nr:biotin transporter BioY [Deltaproteobacteria bacterium]
MSQPIGDIQHLEKNAAVRFLYLPIVRTVVLSGIGSVVLALSARIAIPLPWTPVPVTLQTAVVLLLPLLFGAKIGALSVCFYLLEGAFGIPVFSGGQLGWLHLAGPTGGYLLGFLLSASVVGWLSERGWQCRIQRFAALLLLGHLLIYLPGLLWLSHFVGGVVRAVELGLLPFLLGDFLKTAVVFFTVRQIRKALA